MTYKEFYRWINDLPSRFEYRDLETYLSTLYLQIEKQKTQELTVEKLLVLIEESFKSEAVEFNREWLEIISPPEFDINLLDAKLILNESITFIIDVVKFQIAELHKMKNKQLKDEQRYFGADSETEHRWYNFDPFTNLACGAAWLLNLKDENQEMNMNWQTFGILLEMGRIYE